MKKRWFMIVMFLVLAASGTGWYMLTRAPFAERPPAVGQAAPRLALADLSGRMIQLSDFSGQVILINFWASWCGPCKDQLQVYEKVWRELGDDGFTVLAISTDEIPEVFGTQNHLTFPLLQANDRVLQDYGGIRNVPVTFILNRSGRISRKHKTYYSLVELQEEIRQLLKQNSSLGESGPG